GPLPGGRPVVTFSARAPYLNDEERAAPAPADHFDERQLAALVLMVGLTGRFNRLSAPTRQSGRRGLVGRRRGRGRAARTGGGWPGASDHPPCPGSGQLS
ncbi:hypothetical protein ACFC0M_36150, partial [Streptomyces sp. NPDC056149]